MDHSMHHAGDDAHANAPGRKWLKYLAIGTALAAGTVILAPYLLPLAGIGTHDMADMAMDAMHAGGSGLAGNVSGMLKMVPMAGPTLAAGGIASSLTSAAIGIGGVLLGNFVEKKENGKTGIRWGQVIKYGAILTSALIALPSVLTGISAGIVFLSEVISGVHLAGVAAAFLAKTLGGAPHVHGIAGAAGIAATGVSHLLTCGAAMLPVMFSARLAGKKTDNAESPMPYAYGAGSKGDIGSRYTDGSIIAEMQVDRPTSANMLSHVTLRLTDARTGLPVKDEQLATVYTRKLHLYVVDQSLRDYQHIHPKPTGEPGVFGFSFTPRTSNRYSAWVDFSLLKDGGKHRIKTELPSVARRNIPAVIRSTSQSAQEGLVFDWKSSAPLQKDSPAIVEVTVTDKRGNPVTDLEPVMGAFAHLAGFSADGNHLIHTHPLGAEPTGPDERGGPKLRFHVEPDYAGATQFYLQVRKGDKDIYVPFGQQVKPPEQGAEKRHAVNHAAMQFAHGI